MTQSSFASSQVAWQPDRQSNVPWRSIYINATAFKDYQTNVLPRKHDFTHTTNSLLLDQLCPASLQAQRLPKKLRSMKAKKQLLLSTNSFLTHPAILHYCFQGKTLLSLPIEMTEWKNLPINLVWGRELLTKHQYLIYSYFMKHKSRIFSPKFPQIWWRFYVPATLLTCLLFWELLSLKDISNEVTKKKK